MCVYVRMCVCVCMHATLRVLQDVTTCLEYATTIHGTRQVMARGKAAHGAGCRSKVKPFEMTIKQECYLTPDTLHLTPDT